MSTTQREVPWLVFDGDCAFCTSSSTWVAERLHRDGGPNPRLVASQFVDLPALGTTVERARREVLWVTPSGQIFGGASAAAAWLRFRGGAYGLLGRVLDAPGVRNLAAVGYRLIARNRSRLPGGSPACALPPPGVTPPSATPPSAATGNETTKP